MEVPSATASAKDTKADGGSTPKVSNKEKLKTADMAGLGQGEIVWRSHLLLLRQKI